MKREDCDKLLNQWGKDILREKHRNEALITANKMDKAGKMIGTIGTVLTTIATATITILNSVNSKNK